MADKKEYIASGVIFQALFLERDEEGHIVAEHIMPAAKSYWPYLDISETVARQLAEFSAPARAEQKEK